MSRLLVLRLALPLLASIATGPIAAQTPAAPPQAGWRSITSTHGYSFQVPSDWRTPSGASLPIADTAVQSPSGKEVALVIVATTPASGAGDSASLAQQMTARSSQAAELLGSQAAILRGPDPVQIANAQAGVAVTVSGTVAQVSNVADMRIAVQGAAEYVLMVVAPEDLHNSDPDLAKILNWFQAVLPPTFGLSAEEAVIPLLAYKLGARDLPGFTPGFLYATAPSTIAAQAPSPVLTLRNYQNAGLVVRFTQRLIPTSQTGDTSGSVPTLIVSQFSDAAAAHVFATGQSLPPSNGSGGTFDPAGLGLSLGEASAAWHVSSVPLGQPATGSYYIRWQRGNIGISLQTANQPIGTEQQSEAEKLAAALDSIEGARPAPLFGPATVIPPATEDQRLLAASPSSRQPARRPTASACSARMYCTPPTTSLRQIRVRRRCCTGLTSNRRS